MPAPARAQGDYFAIRVVDADGAPVPCVTLRTVHHLRFVTDASGRVAFHEPGLMDGDVFFYVEGPHVEHEEDFLGYRGRALAVTEGGEATIEVRATGAPPCEPGDRATRRLARGRPGPEGLFRVDVVDERTGRGVPLVELAMDGRRWVSDSGGRVAIDPLGLEGRALEARLSSHGYAFDPPTRTLRPAAGERLEVRATREVLAERLYRVTGGGIYRDSVLLGLDVPLAAPTLAGRVLGQDTVFTTVHRGRLFWIWGDTTRPGYPLGHFRTAGAVSPLPGAGGLDPERGVDLDYFVNDDGFSRPLAPAETVPGDGLIWLSGLVSVPDAEGEPRLFALFGHHASLEERTRFGMVAWDEDEARFEEAVVFDGPDARYPRENAWLETVGGRRWVYYHDPARIPARAEAMTDPRTYEAFSPFADADGTVERDDEGRAVYRWRAGGIPRATAEADLAPADALIGHVVDAATGEGFEVHENGHTAYGAFLGRYLRLISPRWALGEVWLALSDTPMGPWVHAARVLRHDDYTFYNPRHHPALDRDHGRRILFEGTYTAAFSGNPDRTPRYDYNQVMYALDLDRPELALPVPIYRSARGELGPQRVVRPGDPPLAARFFAPVRPRPGTEPVWWSGPDCEPRRLVVGGEPSTPPIFWARPPSAEPGPHQARLHAVWGEPGASPRHGLDDAGNAEPIAVVWANPIRAALPVGDHRRGPFPDAGPDRCLAEGEPLELAPADDGWRVDGEAVSASEFVLAPGLHVVTRRATTEDGREVVDHAIVRVGDPPPLPDPPDDGCGCRAVGAPADGPGAWWILPVVAWAARRRRGALAVLGGALAACGGAAPPPAVAIEDGLDVPVVEARLAGRPVQLLLDTGASQHVVVTDTAHALGVRTEPFEGAAEDGHGAAVAIRRAESGALTLPGYAAPVLFAIDAPPLARRALAGVLSPQLLVDGDRVVVLDLRRGRIARPPLSRLPGWARRTDARRCAAGRTPAEGWRYVIEVGVGGGRLPMLLDTGSTGTVIEAEAATSAGLDAGGAAVVSASAASRVRLRRSRTDLSFAGTNVTVDAGVGERGTPGRQCGARGVLGYDALRRCVLVLRRDGAAVRCDGPVAERGAARPPGPRSRATVLASGPWTVRAADES